jgi:predicted nuclease of predicted toxin-antitoxin system
LKFLVDQQLPPLLAEWLRREGFEASHVRELGLSAASDEVIWRTASQIDAVVITKDEDFIRFHHGTGEARVVWIRMGNCSNPDLIARVQSLWPAVLERLRLGDRLVQLR